MRLALYADMHSNADILTFARRTPATAWCLLGVRVLFAAIVCLLIYSVFATAHAGSFQPLHTIRAAAERFVRDAATSSTAAVVATAGELDPRLQLAVCAGELEASTLNNAPITARNTIGVRCRVGADWNVYLPVNVETETDVLVLREPMARLANLSPSDVAIQRRRVPGLSNLYLGKPEELQNRHLKRSLPAGTVLTVDMMNRNLVVKRGQHVMLVATVGGIDVRAAGTALSDGGNADRIRVQNLSSLKVVEGIVESSNQVRVGM